MRTVSLLISLSLFASTGRIINFDNAPIGKAPPGWTFTTDRGGAPDWEVRRDQTAPTQPYVLAEISNERFDNRFPLAILDGMNLRDGDVSVRIKPIAGKEGQSAGLVWRYRDENNYYVVRANAVEKSVSVYKVENGKRIRLCPGVRHDISPNTWSILKVSAHGDRFQVYVDHRRILQGMDHTFTGAGKVGLWTMGDSVTYFDDFRVYPK
jgi:hypothetical protein